MDKLKELLKRCAAGVHINVNDHRNVYQSAADWLEERKGFECPPEIDDDVRAKIIETDTIIDIVFYPDTPIGSYNIVHYDLDAALDECLACFVDR